MRARLFAGLMLVAILTLVDSGRAQTPAQLFVAQKSATPIDTQSSEISATLVEQSVQDPRQNLPDAPIPVLPSKQDGPMPCPVGVGFPCALLGGRLYFSDPSHMTQHDKTWFDALRNPMLLAGIAGNLAADIWDYRSTRACIANHTCREANPIMGQSRAQELGMGFSLDIVAYFAEAKLKQRGRGNYAFGCLATGTFLHIYFAAKAQALADLKRH